MPTSTEIFINAELPKRPYTNQFPFTAGHIPVATGNGLEVEGRILDVSDITNAASEQYVNDAISNLIDNSPGALDTLNELAAALGDDPNFASTVSTALSNRLRVDINTQGLTLTEKQNGLDNLGITEVITDASMNASGLITFAKNTGQTADTVQIPTAISGLSFNSSTGVLTSSYTNGAIDTTITVAANEVADNVFRIKDNVDSTKKIAFEASAVGTGQTRTITMPNANVDLGLVGQTDFLDTAFRISDNTDATKKIAFDAAYVGSGTTKTITMPNADIDLSQMPVIVNITSNTTYTVSVANRTRDHIILTTSNFTLNAQQLTTSGSVIVRSKDGNPYTVTRSGSQAWNFVGLSTNPITVSAGNDFYLGGNTGSGYHTGYMTGSFAAPSFAIRKGHTSNSPYFTFTAPNLTGTKTITMPNRDINLDGIPFVNDGVGSLGITNNQVNYLLLQQGVFACSLPITYASTGTSTIFVLKSNSVSSAPIFVNFTWSGQSGGFTLSPQVGYSDQSIATTFLEYEPFIPLVISGASGNKIFQIGTLAPGGSAIISVSQNGSGNFGLKVAYIDGQKLGANNSNLKICKSLSSEYIATTINASNLTAANTLTLANKDVNLGNLSSVATTDSNNLSGTRTRILGGSGNTVSGTDNIAIGTTDFMLSSDSQVAIGAGYRSVNNIERVTCADTLILGNVQGYALTVVHRLRANAGNSVFVADSFNTQVSDTLGLMNTPKAVLRRSYFLNARHELTFTATVYSSAGVKAGTISGVRVFGVHYGVGSTTDTIGDYVITSVTPYADLANGDCSALVTASIVEVAGTKEKLLRIHIQAKNATGTSNYLCNSTAELVSHYRLF